MRATLLRIHELPGVVSASGMEFDGENYYIIGDDSPFLYVLDKSFTVTAKRALFAMEVKENNRIPKKQKPDFEALTFVVFQNKKQLLAFGSGSKKQREKLLVIEMTSWKVLEFDLGPFYRQLQKNAHMHADDFNIEAAASDSEYLYLLNRGTNTVFAVGQRHFENYLFSGEFPAVVFNTYKLPVSDTVQAGFSGAGCYENHLIFSASLERTTNWIDDGEILGSYIGLTSVMEIEHTPPCALITTATNEVCKIKVEALAVTGKLGNTYSIIAVTDDDNGASLLLEIELTV